MPGARMPPGLTTSGPFSVPSPPNVAALATVVVVAAESDAGALTNSVPASTFVGPVYVLATGTGERLRSRPCLGDVENVDRVRVDISSEDAAAVVDP